MFGSGFPAFKKVEETITSIGAATEREFLATTEAYQSPAFRSFGVAQVAPVDQVLADIRQREQGQITAKRQTAQIAVKLKADLAPIKPAYADMQARQKKLDDTSSRLDKASKAVQSVTEKYERQSARNPASPDTRKLMNEKEALMAKKMVIEGEFARTEEEVTRLRKVYQKQVFETLLGAFENFVRHRKDVLEAQRKYAEEIGRLGDSISQYSESVPESIRTALDQLREANY
jgi:uncharacterized damage-inducible protein DinB